MSKSRNFDKIAREMLIGQLLSNFFARFFLCKIKFWLVVNNLWKTLPWLPEKNICNSLYYREFPYIISGIFDNLF